jgi:outer membrane protein assembly factor BamB
MNLKRFRLIIAVMIAAFMLVPFASLIQSANAQAVEPWPMWRQNPAHTGEGIGTAPKYLSDPPAWKFKTDAPIFGSPSVAYGNVYFGSQDRNFYCLDAEAGTLKWKYETDWLFRSSPALLDGRVYLGPDDGVIKCLDANSGTTIWTTPVEGGLIKGFFDVNPFQIRSSPTIVGDRLYVGSLDSYVYCVSLVDGSVIWQTKTGKAICSSPAVLDGKVWIGSGDRMVYCLSADNGAVIWKFDTNAPEFSQDPGYRYPTVGTGEVNGSPTIADGKCFFFSSVGSIYFAVDANTGDEIWRHVNRRQRYNYQGSTDAPDPLGMRTLPITYCTPAYHDGYIYVSEDYFMQKIDAETGLKQWEPFTGMTQPDYTDYGYIYEDGGKGGGIFNYELSIGFISQSSYLYADGKIYTGGFAASIYCNDAVTGDRYSWYETDGFIASSPSLAYGKIYVGSIDTSMYCFQEGVPREPRVATSLTATLTTTEPVMYTPVTIEGVASPAPKPDPIRGGYAIRVTLVRPDGTTIFKTLDCLKDQYGVYQGDGSYRLTFNPDMEGTWTANAEVISSQFDYWLPSQAPPLTFTVSSSAPVPEEPPAPTIIPGLPDMYMYAGIAIIAVVIILIIALVWRMSRKK